MKYVIMDILALHKLAIFQHNAEMVMVVAFIAGGLRKNSQRICWQKERYRGFLERTLLGSYLELGFWKRSRMNVPTFKYLCTVLGPVFKKENTKMKESISIECRIAVTLSRLGTNNTLMMVGELFKLGLSTTSEIIRECCKAIGSHLKPLVIKKPTLTRMKQIASEFEARNSVYTRGNRWKPHSHHYTFL
jgi:hypothetical protein